MRLLSRSVLLAVVVVWAAACGPSLDPALKADIDRRSAMLQPGTTAYPGPAPGMVTPMPLAVGQWTQYKVTDDKNQPSFLTQKIVGQSGDALWLETVTESYHGKTAQKILVAFGNRMDPSQVQIRAIIMKDTKGRITELPPAVIGAMQSTYRSAISMLVVSWQGLPQENATAPAGRFEGCFKTRTDAQWGPWRSVADSWAHPAVPLSGMVRSQGVDHAQTMELAAFGTSGATSEL